jgi:hypothetical protein
MAFAMAMFVGETSFAQLEKATEQTKAMLESWTTETNPFKESSQNYNPGLPSNPYGNMNYGRQEVSKSDYEKYLWLFGGGRV